MPRIGTFFTIVAILTIGHNAFASGFRVQEYDNAGQGMANARTASVDDASSVYYNPAAMTTLKEYGAKAGVIFIDPSGTYDGKAGSAEQANTTFAVPHVYVVKPLGDSGYAIGGGLFSQFGLGTTWPQNGPFRYEATDTQLRSSTLNINLAKKVTDTLSVAVGVDYIRSTVRYDAMYPFGFVVPGSADGFRIMEGDGAAFGYNLALHYVPNDRLKIGLSYRSRVTTKFSGDMTIENFPSAIQPLLAAHGISGDDYVSGAGVEITYPDTFSVGASWQTTDRLTLEFDVEHVGWSSYDQLNFTFDKPLISPTGSALLPASSNIKKDWTDTNVYRLGAIYAYSPAFTMRAGFQFDPTPIPGNTFEPRTPDADRKMYSVGFSYKANDNFTVDASFSRIEADSRSVSNTVGNSVGTSVSGDYKSNANIFGLTFGYVY